MTKQKHTFKDFANFHNVKILNSFKAELQLKDTESAIFTFQLKGRNNYQ